MQGPELAGKGYEALEVILSAWMEPHGAQEEGGDRTRATRELYVVVSIEIFLKGLTHSEVGFGKVAGLWGLPAACS